MTKQLKIFLTRESVSQGDDVFAPHEKIISFSSNRNVTELIKEIRSIHYLVNIFGDKATWVMKNGKTRIAVIAQEWTNPKLIVDKNILVDNLEISEDRVNIHFDYLAQQDPDIVYQKFMSSEK